MISLFTLLVKADSYDSIFAHRKKGKKNQILLPTLKPREVEMCEFRLFQRNFFSQ